VQVRSLKRWTRQAKDFEQPHGVSSSSIDNQLEQNLLHASTHEFVQSTDPEASEILLKHRSMARREIQQLTDKRHKEPP